LARVIPKPSRAAYPCQRAAFPLASAFVVWLAGAAGSLVARRQVRKAAREGGRWKAFVCAAVAATAALAAILTWPETPAVASSAPHGPLGEAKGIHPGRVVWVHAPEATDWGGFASPERWWQPNHTDLATVEAMVSAAVRAVAGASSDAAAWEAIFRHFNETHGRGARGYQPGEKLAFKINLTACNARGEQVDPVTYEKKSDVMNSIDNSPQMLLVLLRQLVYVVGANPRDLSVGDPTGLFPKFMYDMIHGEFPEVCCFDNRGGSGRTRTEFSSTPFNWSTPAAKAKLQDYVPRPFAEADYLINFAILKGHSAGITVCAKNHYGSLLRCPDGYLRNAGNLNYYDMHASLPGIDTAGMGRYRALVDLMAHRQLGGKTLLYLVDGLFGGYYWDSRPYKWKLPPFGDGVNADWPSSLFASLDPVAIDSVTYDFLLAEWPRVVTGGTGAAGSLKGSAEDYLHEAALADSPPSGAFYDPEQDGVRLASLGVHEHWNNSVDKQYSRNRGLGHGIELVALQVSRPAPRLVIRRAGNQVVLSWVSSLTGYRLQVSGSLNPNASWTTLAASPGFYQGWNAVTNEVSGGGLFYRLAK
jgi:hypothetical protein